MALQSEDLDYLYSALSHEVRRSMIRNLGEEGVLSFSEIMEKSGVRDTGTFGFHLKRMEPLLEKLTDGRYGLTSLGQAAYRILRFTLMAEEDQKHTIQPSEETKAEIKQPIGGVSVLSEINKLLLNKERLERYDKVSIEDCGEVMIDSDVDADLFKSKVLTFKEIGKTVVPTSLYKLVLSRTETGVGNIETYDGQLPLEKDALPRNLENYSENIMDCSNLKPGTRITNYAILTMRNLTKETLENISFQTNYGVLKVPRGFKQLVLMKLRPEENYGVIEEY